MRKYFELVTKEALMRAYDQLPGNIQVLAKRYRGVFSYCVDTCLKKSPGTENGFSIVQLKWIEGTLLQASRNQVPEDSLFSSFMGVQKSTGQEITARHAEYLEEITDFLGPQPPKGSAIISRGGLSLVVNKT